MTITNKPVLELLDDRSPDVSTEFLNSLAGYRLRQVSNVFMSEFAAAMAGTGMRPVQVSIISVVDENPGIRQGEIGRALGVARANMAPLMAELEAMGLLTRIPDEADRRAVSVFLTKQGQAMLKNCKARIMANERRVLERLTESERKTLLRLLNKI
ncbi:MarR family winged helix-turn-helix transcriptional regulator [Hyphococcus sp.]|uniref:MarR family winged helix-turn-helix transcriptional regulator n=1 Tax=Hyphococcus sp. TaxID=2038636 RepID=UPI003D10ACDB